MLIILSLQTGAQEFQQHIQSYCYLVGEEELSSQLCDCPHLSFLLAFLTSTQGNSFAPGDKIPQDPVSCSFCGTVIRVPSMSTIGSPACHIDLQIEESALILKFYGAFCAVLYIITTFFSHLRNLMRPDKFLTCFPLFLLEISFLSPTLG